MEKKNFGDCFTVGQHSDAVSYIGYAGYTTGMRRTGRWRAPFYSDWQGYSADFGDHLGYDIMNVEVLETRCHVTPTWVSDLTPF